MPAAMNYVDEMRQSTPGHPQKECSHQVLGSHGDSQLCISSYSVTRKDQFYSSIGAFMYSKQFHYLSAFHLHFFQRSTVVPTTDYIKPHVSLASSALDRPRYVHHQAHFLQ